MSSSAGININIDNFTLDVSLGFDDTSVSGSLTNGNTTDTFGIKLNLSELNVGFEKSTAVKWDNTTDVGYTNVSVSGKIVVAAYLWYTTGQPIQSPSYSYSNAY